MMYLLINKNMHIYLIINQINDKKYVGQTIQKPQDRWKSHIHKTFNPNMAINHAMKKYGIENFKFEVIDECLTRDELNEAESKWIEYYDTFLGVGYNCTSGGEGYVVSEESKKKMSECSLGDKNHFYGKTHTEETKIKISETNKGHKRCVGRKYSKETLKKMSVSGKNRTDNIRSIIQINKTTGEEIACWLSIKDAGEFLNIPRPNISRALPRNDYSAGGFKWRYANVSI